MELKDFERFLSFAVKKGTRIIQNSKMIGTDSFAYINKSGLSAHQQALVEAKTCRNPFFQVNQSNRWVAYLLHSID